MNYAGKEYITEGYPKEMMVRDNKIQEWKKALIFAKIPSDEYPFMGIHNLNTAFSCWRYVKDIKTERKIENGVKQGDILLEDAGGDSVCKVLGVCGEIIFLSQRNQFHKPRAGIFSLNELIYMGYTLKMPENEIEITIEQIAEKMGVNSSRIRIKE